MIINWNKLFGFLFLSSLWQVVWLTPHILVIALSYLKKLSSRGLLTTTLIHAPLAIVLMSYDPWMGTVFAITIAPIALVIVLIITKLRGSIVDENQRITSRFLIVYLAGIALLMLVSNLATIYRDTQSRIQTNHPKEALPFYPRDYQSSP